MRARPFSNSCATPRSSGLTSLARMPEPDHIALYTEHSSVGGAGRYLADLARRIAARGRRTTVLAPASPLSDFLREEAAGAEVIALPAVAAPGAFVANTTRLLVPTMQLARTLHSLRPDVLHISNGGYPGSDFCRAAAVVSRRPTVMTVHAAPSPREPVRERVHREFDRVVWGSLDRVLSASQAVVDALVGSRDLPPSKARVAPYGVEDAVVRPERVAELRRELDADGRLLVGLISSPGSNLEWKGYRVFAEAVVRVAEETPLAIVFVGMDPGAEYEDALRAAACRPLVKRAGLVDDPRAYLAAFDALCVPSIRYENLPLTILESMSAARPVIASRISGIPEAVDHHVDGILCTPGDAGELAAALQWAASAQAELREMGRDGRSKFERRYTLDAMVDGVLAAYAELA
jgi:glycosyltransferase involved in cell wall biosynthesis